MRANLEEFREMFQLLETGGKRWGKLWKQREETSLFLMVEVSCIPASPVFSLVLPLLIQLLH